ncbi:MAG: secretin N-terminal domain-containing protein, partial [Planctomycetota bacterium]
MIAKNCQHKLRTGVFTLSLFWLGLSAYAPLAAQRANSRDFIPGDKANPESSTRNYYSQSDNRSPIIVDPNIVKARFDSVDRPELDSRTSKSVEANSVDYSTPWRYQLKTLNHEQFESKLAQIWGDRLRAEILDSNNRVARIFFPEGRMAPESSMRFDRATGLLTYEGDPSRKKAWYELMSAIDRPVNPYEKTGVGIIDVSFADPGIVGQISAVIQDQEDGRLQVPIENLNEEVLEALTTQDIPDLKGPIRVRRSAETNTLIIEGDEEDVAKVKKFLDEFLQDTKSIDRIAKPIQLYNATPEDLQSRIQEIYDNQFANIHGPASVTAIAATNSLLVAGQKSAVEELENLIRQIDGEK